MNKKGFAIAAIPMAGFVVIAVVVLILFGIPLVSIGVFIAQNAKLVIIFGALLFVLSLVSGKAKK